VIDLEKVGRVWQSVVDAADTGGDGEPTITASAVSDAVPAPKPKPKPFDFNKAYDKLFEWNRAQIKLWPADTRDAMSQAFRQLSKEANPQ
jgi:hypothetical protein